MADDLIQFDGGALVADIVSNSVATNEIELTQYPIETGAFISDHAIQKPFTLELELRQTESPLAAPGFRTQSIDLTYPSRPQGSQNGRADVRQVPVQLTLQGLGGAALSALGGGPAKEIRWTGQKTDEGIGTRQFKVSVLAADNDITRVNEFHDGLLSLQAATTVCVVTVKGQPYIDMVLTSVRRTDEQGKAGCASFGVTFQQIRTVETQTVDLPPVPKKTAKKSLGTKTTSVPDEKKIRKTLTLAGAQRLTGLLQDGG